LGVTRGGAVPKVRGRGGKARLVAPPESLAHRPRSHAFDRKPNLDDRVFGIKRKWAWQLVKDAAERAGFAKKVHPHLLRDPNAIECFRQTRNPIALQLHLGHFPSFLTMRYLSTLMVAEALRIHQEVDFD